MSHSSGIAPSSGLVQAFTSSSSLNSPVRLIKAEIVDESIEAVEKYNKISDWKSDISMIAPLLADKEPSFFLLKTDEAAPATSEEGSQNPDQAGWVLFCYVPDHAHIRRKMLYASSRATLTKSLGQSQFIDEFYGSEKAEFTTDGYNAYLKSHAADKPLSYREEEMLKIRLDEATGDVSVSTRRAHVHGVDLPADAAALEALQGLAAGRLNYVQLTANMQTEKVELVHSATGFNLDNVQSVTEPNVPRFHLVREPSARGAEGDTLFVYCCPQGSPVRARMLHASCRAAAIGAAKDSGLALARVVEIGDIADLNSAFVQETLQPTVTGTEAANAAGIARLKFDRPQRPGARR
ncbi:hypothetical protein H696_00233 [Fonticula alba]|uniref:ADF-H domain-containing protein n=1 Tax=Fonticula alba TaxID=691883 RepID=A0A058ZGN0_FONAL|nr:hypothetical protein H696_00233 [Fonticula alba]KCV72652.1 hypothetical protein H696_00233 [Fonticula alba]|eukprot:XP_009492353.1 hypothetical protein H696_00233 [Fonticula alba]